LRYISAKDKSRLTFQFLLNPEGKKLEDMEDISNSMNNTFASNFSVNPPDKPPCPDPWVVEFPMPKIMLQWTRLRKV